MATRLKTVHYAFPVLASLADNTLTNLTQITIYLPESSKTFKSVVARLTADDLATSGASISTRTVGLRLGAAAYTSISNTNVISSTGENHSFLIPNDFTSHFSTNWSGSSMTCDFRTLIDGTTAGFTNVCVTLEITYEYDDTSTTQVKSVFIPLNMPEGELATSATTYDTIPALDTYLPEASKTYRNIAIVVQGSLCRVDATDFTMTLNVGTANITTGNYEAALLSTTFIRYVWNITSAYPDTSATQNWQPISSLATRFNHFQAYMVVTYEYNESTSTSIMNSVMLPMNFDGDIMGGATSSDFVSGRVDLWIEEPATISGGKVAFYLFYGKTAPIAGLNARIGTGSFVAYTDHAGTVIGGSDGLMIRNDSAFTLARGKNTLNCDVYRTDTTDRGIGISGFWIVTYSSGKALNGSGSHNKTVALSMLTHGTAADTHTWSVALGASIPETSYFVNNYGFVFNGQTAGALGAGDFPYYSLRVERLSGEQGGHSFVDIVKIVSEGDAETGVIKYIGNDTKVFKRWIGDTDSKRIDIETSRIYSVYYRYNVTNCTLHPDLDMLLTYHSIESNVADSITGFSGTVNLALHDDETGEKLLETTRSGDGAFSFTWYDNTRDVYVVANDGTNVGRSQSQPAVLDT